MVLVLDACAADWPFTWTTSAHGRVAGCEPSRTRAARLLAATGQTGRVDPAPLGVGPIVVGDEADGLGVGIGGGSRSCSGTICSSRRGSSLIHYRACIEGHSGRARGVERASGAAVAVAIADSAGAAAERQAHDQQAANVPGREDWWATIDSRLAAAVGTGAALRRRA